MKRPPHTVLLHQAPRSLTSRCPEAYAAVAAAGLQVLLQRALGVPTARVHMGDGDLTVDASDAEFLRQVGRDLGVHGKVILTVIWGDRGQDEWETLCVLDLYGQLSALWLGEEEHHLVAEVLGVKP